MLHPGGLGAQRSLRLSVGLGFRVLGFRVCRVPSGGGPKPETYKIRTRSPNGPRLGFIGFIIYKHLGYRAQLGLEVRR